MCLITYVQVSALLSVESYEYLFSGLNQGLAGQVERQTQGAEEAGEDGDGVAMVLAGGTED